MSESANAPAPTRPSTEAQEAARRQREAVEHALNTPVAHSTGAVQVAGQTLAYRVSAGFVPVRGNTPAEAHGEPEAAVFTTAYQLEGADPAQRGLCFAFNGGPGASSIFLHFGVMGPKRVRINDDGSMPPPPYGVEDNPLSWLAHFDLVFVDPPHTGYSISASDEARKKHFSVDGDVAALCEVVREWLSRHQRWASPLLLCGESYGTTRCAAIAEGLCDMGIALSGLILVSSAMDIQALEFAPRNDLPYALYLPAFAGAAHYHGTAKPGLASSPEAARQLALDFVHSDYLSALHRGASLDERARLRVAKRVGELTGLAPELVAQHNLRISDTTFFVEALRPQARIVGRMDARVTGPMGASLSRQMDFDPGLDPLWGPYAMAAMDQFGRQLGLAPDRRYQVFGMEVNKQWNWCRGESKGNSYTCTSVELARVIRRLPHLRVLVASGVYDLATPVSATDWMLDQLDLQPAQRSQLRHCRYGAGHMMYSRQADLLQMHQDLGDWLAVLPGLAARPVAAPI
ncbi:S10 family peptidase [Ideonella sp.]|uniref:S10 family peptidase n=1 Tax=Ideonella sp. TaxID=1929293 RepID=UPI003BB66FF3